MNCTGILKYVGQFIDGRLGGYGISFDDNGKMNRKGLFKNGFFQNRGILYDKNQRITYIGGKNKFFMIIGGMSVKRQEFGTFNYYDRRESFGVSFYPSGKVWFYMNKFRYNTKETGSTIKSMALSVDILMKKAD